MDGEMMSSCKRLTCMPETKDVSELIFMIPPCYDSCSAIPAKAK